MGTIQVKGREITNHVILWEVNSAHPKGEIFVVADGKTHEVGLTPRVKVLLGQGLLVEVGNSNPTSQEDRPTLPLPWAGYDEQKVDEIAARLEEVDDETRANVLAFEKAKGARGRKTIIETLVGWNS